MIRVLTSSEEQTRAVGRRLASVLGGGDVVLLVGGLGAGKTTFVKGMAEGLGYEGEVTSPTFTLCHCYPGRLDLVHVDMWRLERVDEIRDLALEEDLEGGAVLVAEWGEAAEGVFGEGALQVLFGAGASVECRELTFDPAPAWAGRSEQLAAAVAGNPCGT
ncbi:MAG: tRNA (adenosine(37)-N6)-threonylcarbamoyltransferase complex ATPase subunit type 1 TsaE [Acidimicrobiales bacterium]